MIDYRNHRQEKWRINDIRTEGEGNPELEKNKSGKKRTEWDQRKERSSSEKKGGMKK